MSRERSVGSDQALGCGRAFAYILVPSICIQEHQFGGKGEGGHGCAVQAVRSWSEKGKALSRLGKASGSVPSKLALEFPADTPWAVTV